MKFSFLVLVFYISSYNESSIDPKNHPIILALPVCSLGIPIHKKL